jgi:hypothetical protein
LKSIEFLKRISRKINTKSAISSMLFWNLQLILILAALLLVDSSIRLSVLLAYLAAMTLVLVTKFHLEKAIHDHSAIDQLRDELTAHRETTSIISYLNSVLRPRIPIWYTRAYRDYSASPEMLEELFNRIISARPKTVFELGSGLTTLISSYALQKNGYGKVVSWDCLETRASSNRDLIDSHDQGQFAEILDATPQKNAEPGSTSLWFDKTPEEKIDFLVVDDSMDPPLTPSSKGLIQALRPYLNIGSTIFLHDRIRPVDKDTLGEWIDADTELLLIHTIHTKTNTYSVLRYGPW